MNKPTAFDLLTEIASANTIRLATAFAHETGWNMPAPTISASKAKTFLLTGKSFFQTEPEVLRKWLWLSRSGRVEAKLHFQKGITFHPKVFLVDGKRPFAIVGLGNLSRGGLHGNVECAIFVDSSTVLRELRAWFDTIFSSNATAVPLTEALILDYERKYKALRKPITELRKQQQQFERNSA